ncbi:MAG: hypothetical protein U1D55_02400 [Phycisphaerae bacterium]
MRSWLTTGVVAGLALALCLSAPAQVSPEDFSTGIEAASWEKWQTALRAMLERNPDAAETAFGELMALKPSAMRVALLAERSVMRSDTGGAVLVMEQDLASNTIKGSAKAIADLLVAGREQLNQADDGWYFASVGRFDVADANFKALAASKPDPVALLEFADRVRRRQEILVQLSTHPVVGESARAVMRLLAEGERHIKADPLRINDHLSRLGGPPRAFENSLAWLKESGEYAVPFAINTLRDADRRSLTPAVVKALPLIGRPALNPLVASLAMKDQTTIKYAIAALGRIGYSQAIPYLLKVRQAAEASPDIVLAVDEAMNELRRHGVRVEGGNNAAEAFLALARAYYDNDAALAADPRLDTANVWYWRNNLLLNTEVPTAIFDEVMAMRCAEEALLLNPNLKPAIAVWLGANFRREAQLGGAEDATRPANYPSAGYFAQSAGAEYCLMALTKAVDDKDAAVSLGLIEALRKTAGPVSLTGTADGRPALAEALSFPDRMVRVRAALALGAALADKPFYNLQALMPALGEALTLHAAARGALVVDSDETSANAIAAALRAEGFEVLVDAKLFPGLDKARSAPAGADFIFLAADTQDPSLSDALRKLREEARFAGTPVVLIDKVAGRQTAAALSRTDRRVALYDAEQGPEALKAAMARVSKSAGVTALSPEMGLSIAMEAAGVLRNLAATKNSLVKVQDAEKPLIGALKAADAGLRVAAAQVLAYVPSKDAQEAVASIALDDKAEEAVRVSMFDAMALAAKQTGNMLSDASVKRLTSIAEGDSNMAIRAAASQALGALNLAGNPASAIIRNQYGG